MSYVIYVATFEDKLYYTNFNTQTVTCCDLQGTTQWEFKDERVLRYPLGITCLNKSHLFPLKDNSLKNDRLGSAMILLSS
jgi:hypothetical protein